ncbi:hypothetical protein D3C84_921260 [compost metagenome]
MGEDQQQAQAARRRRQAHQLLDRQRRCALRIRQPNAADPRFRRRLAGHARHAPAGSALPAESAGQRIPGQGSAPAPALHDRHRHRDVFPYPAPVADRPGQPGSYRRTDGLGAGLLGGANRAQATDQAVSGSPAPGPAVAFWPLAAIVAAPGTEPVRRLVQLDAGAGRTGLLAAGIVQRRCRP